MQTTTAVTESYTDNLDKTVEWHKYEHLCNFSSQHYKECHMPTNLWKEISINISLDVARCANRWKTPETSHLCFKFFNESSWFSTISCSNSSKHCCCHWCEQLEEAHRQQVFRQFDCEIAQTQKRASINTRLWLLQKHNSSLTMTACIALIMPGCIRQTETKQGTRCQLSNLQPRCCTCMITNDSPC